MNKWEYQIKPCYLEDLVVREPCKQRTACISSILERHTINWTSFLSAPMIIPEMGNLDNGETMKTITGFPFSKKHPNRIDWDDDLVSSRPPQVICIMMRRHWTWSRIGFFSSKNSIFSFEGFLNLGSAALFHNGLNWSLDIVRWLQNLIRPQFFAKYPP